MVMLVAKQVPADTVGRGSTLRKRNHRVSFARTSTVKQDRLITDEYASSVPPPPSPSPPWGGFESAIFLDDDELEVTAEHARIFDARRARDRSEWASMRHEMLPAGHERDRERADITHWRLRHEERTRSVVLQCISGASKRG